MCTRESFSSMMAQCSIRTVTGTGSSSLAVILNIELTNGMSSYPSGSMYIVIIDNFVSEFDFTFRLRCWEMETDAIWAEV